MEGGDERQGPGRQHPFRELRHRDHITLRFDPVADEAGGAIYARRGRRAVIVLSPGLDQVEREDSLAHELEHDELGVVQPPASDLTMERIENIADRRTTAWLVPRPGLLAFVLGRSEVEPITAAVVAAEFRVTEARAQAALDDLQRHLLDLELRRAARAHPANPSHDPSHGTDGPLPSSPDVPDDPAA
ncbi:ImmA/IrrE family metallo-endopeptidase [Aquihabitans sp. G128]|uniref:ImmA/IrrE family metallo-endopeptidase n=1 Tax=Aquihabitans sp. G128 TaxID=2849779 RepID=UPI001C21DDBC|nr:ImmA/IrrE family metallo-endopeptidase [Aquihabitans sp. G128]QXC59365.1 ImmA/IrrE family metallo-endopeptidase [Aquihabitans sp. G128]